MNGGRVTLNVKTSVPNMVDLGVVRGEFHRCVNLNGGAVAYSRHVPSVQRSGGGGETEEVKGTRKQRAFLELDRRVKNVREEDELTRVRIRKRDEDSRAGHLGGSIRVDPPPDPPGRRDECSEEAEVEGRVVWMVCPRD